MVRSTAKLTRVRAIMAMWLALTILSIANEATEAAADTPVGTLFAQKTRVKRKRHSRPIEIPIWSYFVAFGVGLGVVAGVVVYKQRKGQYVEESTSPAASVGSTSGMTGGAGGTTVGSTGVPETLGNYRLLNLMMTGQTSQVWEATETSSGRHFAIKILLPEHAANSETREFLFHEAEVGIELAHPNIIKVVGVVRSPKHPHFIMDFFPGGSLKLRIMRKEQDFIKEKAQDILKQAATALAFMNAKGWVHRDVKPDNILVNAAGEVRIIDFAIAYKIPTGLAKLLRRKGLIQGTRSYMSPEQIRNEELDGRADIYSFGATAYEIVTGRPPFRGASNQDLLNKQLNEKALTPRSHNPEVTEEFAELVLRMLSKKREQRPNNFHEILMALHKVRVFKQEAAKKS